MSNNPDTFSWKWGFSSHFSLHVIKWMQQSLKILIISTLLCQNLLTGSLRHIRASASNNTQRDANSQALWESINIWLYEESNTRISFLTTSSVVLWLCHPDLQLQNKSSADVFLIVTSDRAKSQTSDELHTATSWKSCSTLTWGALGVIVILTFYTRRSQEQE